MFRHAGRAVAIAVALLAQPVSWTGQATAFELVTPESEGTVSIVVGTGQLIRVDKEFSSLFIANPDVADIEVKSPRLLYLTGVGVGETTLFAVDDDDNVLMSATIKVTHNTGALSQGISRVAPGQSVTATTVDQSLVITGTVETTEQAEGVMQVANQFVDAPEQVVNRIRVSSDDSGMGLAEGLSRVAPGQNVAATVMGESLVLTGTVQTPEQAANVVQVATQFVDDPAKLVNQLTVAAPTQVNLQVRIAEVSRNVDRQLGIRWNALGISSNDRTRYGVVGGTGTSGTGSWTGSLGYSGPNIDIDVVLQALADEGLITVLAEPNLTARSGESASFLAGGEYPYSTVSDNGTNVQFKDFGIGLNFTPTVMDGNRISLKVATQVSELDFATNPNVPSLRSRRAETTVDLGSGESFAIAGLMQNSSAQSMSRMPGLGAVPVVGALFRSNGFKRGQTELVIIVTPVVVGPTTPARVAAPTDTYIPPNDFERIVLGRFQGNRKQVEHVRSRMGQRRLYGASGFVFE